MVCLNTADQLQITANVYCHKSVYDTTDHYRSQQIRYSHEMDKVNDLPTRNDTRSNNFWDMS